MAFETKVKKMIKLIAPSVTYKESYLASLKGGVIKKHSPEDIINIEKDLENYIENEHFKEGVGTRECEDGTTGRLVDMYRYWLVDDEGKTYLGQFDLRLELTPFLTKYSGHIGYVICPKHRKKGYGTLGLKLTLEKAETLIKEGKVLVTCNDENIGSAKVIENNGGVLENIVEYDWYNKPIRRYWIKL